MSTSRSPASWLRRRVILAAGLAVGTSLFAQTVQGAEEGISVKLTTSEGTEIIIEDARVELGDGLIDISVASWTSSWKYLETFVLRSTEGVYFGIPVGIFQEARLVNGLHVVTLTNGRQMEGTLVGGVKRREKEGEEEDKKSPVYLFSAVKLIQVVSLPSWEREEVEREKMRQIKPEWIHELEVGLPEGRRYTVYNKSICYESGGFGRLEDDWEKAKTVFLSSSGQEEQVSLAKYAELIFDKRPEGIWTVVRYKDGHEKGGLLTIKNNAGTPATKWLLVATLADGTGIKIVLRGTSFTFRRGKG